LQQATYERERKKILKGIEELKRRGKKSGRGRKMTAKGAINTLANLIPKQLRGIFRYRVIEIEGRIEIECRVDPKAEKELCQSFGKIVIFTDLHQVGDEQLVRSYNSKSMIENDFKWLKDKTIMPLMPFWVRLDLSVRAHVFICVLGLLLYRYLLWRIGEKLSIPSMVDILGRIRFTVVASREGKPKIMLEEMDAEEVRIFTKLNLLRYIPG
jgi:transposase